MVLFFLYENSFLVDFKGKPTGKPPFWGYPQLETYPYGKRRHESTLLSVAGHRLRDSL